MAAGELALPHVLVFTAGAELRSVSQQSHHKLPLDCGKTGGPSALAITHHLAEIKHPPRTCPLFPL